MGVNSGARRSEGIEARANALSLSIQQPFNDLERERHKLRLATEGKDVFLTKDANNEIHVYTGVAAKVRRAAYSLQRSDSELANDQEVFKSNLASRVNKLKIEIQREINAFVEKVEATPDLSESEARAVRDCFFNTLSKLPEDVFERSIVKRESKLEGILAEGAGAGKIQEKRKVHGRAVDAAAFGKTLVDLIESEAILALALGVQPESGGDASTAFYLRDLSRKRIAVFKPDDMGSRAPNNPKMSIVKRIWNAIRTDILGHEITRQARKGGAQFASYQISSELGLHNVAPTKISQIASVRFGKEGKVHQKSGSLQVLIPGAQDANKVLGLPSGCTGQAMWSWLKRSLKDSIKRLMTGTSALEVTRRVQVQPSKEAFEKVPKELFKQLAVLDFILGDVDRKPANWMIVSSPEEKEGEKKEAPRVMAAVSRYLATDEKGRSIVAIDCDAAFPKGRSVFGETKNQYLWAELPDTDKTTIGLLSGPIGDREAREKIVLKNLIDGMLVEDVPNLEMRSKAREVVDSIVDQFIPSGIAAGKEKKTLFPGIEEYQTSSGRLTKMPSLKTMENVVSKVLPKGLQSKKTVRNIAKTILQAISAKERSSILQCFIDPPKKQEGKFTLKLLGSIRTEEEVQAFWKFYDSAVKEAAN